MCEDEDVVILLKGVGVLKVDRCGRSLTPRINNAQPLSTVYTGVVLA
jgi:hypothetical protein